jgi:hypothetical protein
MRKLSNYAVGRNGEREARNLLREKAGLSGLKLSPGSRGICDLQSSKACVQVKAARGERKPAGLSKRERNRLLREGRDSGRVTIACKIELTHDGRRMVSGKCTDIASESTVASYSRRRK